MRLFPADQVVLLPDWIDDRTAVSLLLKGMTAEYLLRRTYDVKKGDWIVVHAAAGGVGLFAGEGDDEVLSVDVDVDAGESVTGAVGTSITTGAITGAITGANTATGSGGSVTTTCAAGV